MDYDEMYNFSFRIESIGVKKIGDVENVVYEFRAYLTGTEKQIEPYNPNLKPNQIAKNKKFNNSIITKKNLKDPEIKERFFVSTIKVDELNVESLIPLEEVTQELIYEWLEKSFHSDNLLNLKKAIHEAFNPEIKYYNMDYFKVNP
jgi:hypothetical protein